VNLLKVTPIYKTLSSSLEYNIKKKTKPVSPHHFVIWFKDNHCTNNSSNVIFKYPTLCKFNTKLLYQHTTPYFNFKLTTISVNYNRTSLKKLKKLKKLKSPKATHTPLFKANQAHISTFNNLLEKDDFYNSVYLTQFTVFWQLQSFHFLTLASIKLLLLNVTIKPKYWSKTSSLTLTGGTPLLLTLKWL
jgi:hypothetical protein